MPTKENNMKKFKHQMAPSTDILGATYKCVFCDYINYTACKDYPYPERWHFFNIPEVKEVHCPKSNVKITFWERLAMSVNLLLKLDINGKDN